MTPNFCADFCEGGGRGGTQQHVASPGGPCDGRTTSQRPPPSMHLLQAAMRSREWHARTWDTNEEGSSAMAMEQGCRGCHTLFPLILALYGPSQPASLKSLPSSIMYVRSKDLHYTRTENGENITAEV